MTSVKDDTDNKTNLLDDWSDVDWANVNKSVKRLRRRIFQARKEANFRKLRSLQKLMLKSSSNILFSIRKIASNQGKNSFGVDGFLINSPKDKLDLFYEIKENKYFGREPKPTRRIYIKEPNKLRPIGIPTIYDRIIQTMVNNSLEPEWEAVFEKGSYGFRPGRNVDDTVSRIWLSLNKSGSRKWVVDTDISKCFDSIAHDYIIGKVQNFPGVNLIKKWLKTGIIINGLWLGSGEEGTPQGSAISPLLCNIALHGLEKELGVKYTSQGKVVNGGRSIIRYADDLIILCYSKKDAFEALELLKKCLEPRGLEISETKTRIVHVVDGFDFLGYTFQLKPKANRRLSECVSNDPDYSRIKQENMGLYVNPSEKSIKKVKAKLKEITKKFGSNMSKVYIRKMNEVIRGYAQARWYWHSSVTFSKLSHYVHTLCWRFACRRTKMKSKKWIKENYFTHLKLEGIDSKWVFFDKYARKDGPLSEKYMYQFGWFKITNYLMSQMDRHPDDKKDIEYYKNLNIDRLTRRPFSILNKLNNEVAASQGHNCALCNESLINGEKVHLHHITPRASGGKYVFSNLVLIHQQCHIQAHNPKRAEEIKDFFILYRKQHSRIRVKKK